MAKLAVLLVFVCILDGWSKTISVDALLASECCNEMSKSKARVSPNTPKVAIAGIPKSGVRETRAAAPEYCHSLEVPILVFNEAGVSETDLAKAEEATDYVLQRVGVSLRWTNRSGRTQTGNHEGSSPATSMRLYIHILQAARGPSDDIFGVAFVAPGGVGHYIDVFYGPIRDLGYVRLSAGSVLGYVIAHEIGHLLLGAKSHSTRGIMKAHWGSRELGQASMGQLLFSPAESSRMRSKISETQSCAVEPYARQ